MSNRPLSPSSLRAVRKSLRGFKAEIIQRSGCTRQTVDNTLNGYYIRFGRKIPYSNENVMVIAIKILERENKKTEDLEEKIKKIT